MSNVSKAMEYAATFEREAMREKLDAALGDLDHMNLIQLEEMVLHHRQQIKDIAAHLLELKQRVTPMMQFKREKLLQEPVAWLVTYAGLTRVVYTQPTQVVDTHYQPLYATPPQRKWVGLTGDEIEDLPKGCTLWEIIRAAEAILKEKNNG